MADHVRVIEIPERGQQYFRRADLVDQHGKSLILHETRKLGAIEVTDEADGSRVMALGLIGYLPLTSCITLNIVPKFPITNLWTMLEIGEESYSKIIPTIRNYQTSPSSAPTHMLARSFCHYIKEAVATGFERTYYSGIRTGYYRPRVEFGPTINKFISRGNPINTVSSVFDFGLDGTVNQVIKAACLRFGKLIPNASAWEEELYLLRLALDTLQNVKAREPTSIDIELEQSISLRLRPHYAGMLRVYHLLLSGGGISFTFEPGGKELPSFLFNLDDIFERFIRRTFLLGLIEDGINVQDGNKHQGNLFEDSKVYKTKSDIIFRLSNHEIIGIGEVKYKPKIKEADRYQMISHVTSAKAPIGILFTPTNNGESQRLERLGKLPTGAQFYHYRINLMGPIEIAQIQMVRDIRNILRAI